MMKRTGLFYGFFLIVIVLLFTGVLFAGVETVDVKSRITFQLSDLGLGQWQYIYSIENVSLMEGIEEFTIYFDSEYYSNLHIETTGPIADTWDELAWQPIQNVNADGGYDAKAEMFLIGPSMTASGFSVSFDWLGQGSPGSQYYEIIDAVTFETIDSDWTVPEPTSLLLLGIGSFCLARQRVKK